MFQGFLFVLLFILASNRFFSQSFDATETNSINGIFAFPRRSFNTAYITWPSPKGNKTLILLALFLSGDIQTIPGPRHQPVYPCGFCELAVSWSPNEEAVRCDECSIWYHRSCLEMCTKDYNTCQRIQQEDPIIHQAPPTKLNSPSPEQARLHLTSYKRTKEKPACYDRKLS